MHRFWLMVVLAAVVMLQPVVVWAQDGEERAHEDLALLAIPTPASLASAWQTPLVPVFQRAAADYDVPLPLLLALGELGSAFEDRQGAPTIERGYGVMALRENTWGGDSLALAAALTTVDVQQLKLDPVANIRGAAAVLDEYARQASIDRGAGLEAWVPAVVRYAGLDEESSQIFAMEVYERLRDGFEISNNLGETFALDPQALAIDPASLAPPVAQLESSDYGPAIWDPAASCNYSAYYTSKDTIIVHTIEGSAAGARSWFKNCNAQVSAHYVISEGGSVWQCVRESYKAWHVSCYNSRSIGLEHEGYARSSSHPTALYNASGDLSRNICNDWGIPKSKRTTGPGILGHIDVTRCCCGTHTDPGSGWNWSYYIDRVQGSPPPQVDNADYVSSTIPGSLKTGQKVTVTVKFKNNGTTTWTSGAGYKLGAVNGTDPFAATYHNVSGTIAPGATASFTFTMTAPSTAGTYRSDWRMLKSGVHFFGDTHAKDITVTAPPPAVDDADYVSTTIPNSMSTGQALSVTITFKNSGTTTWTGSGGYKISAVGGSDPFGASSHALGSSESVAPGASKAFSFTMTAPSTAGTYRTDWRMAKGSTFFGDTFGKDVAVSVPPPTDNADFISSTIPSTALVGQHFSVSVTFKNNGTTTWTPAAGYKLGAVGDSDPFAETRQLLDDGDSIAPGEQKTFSFDMDAPTTAGTYATDWRMVKEGVHWFGDTHTKNVTVSTPPLADLFIEARTGGKNHGWYSEDGTFMDTTITCGASGCTAGIGSRYASTYRSVVGVKAAIFAPSFPETAQYKVYTAWANVPDRRSPIRCRVNHAGGTTDVNVNQTGAADTWVLLGTFTFNAGQGGSLRVSNEAIDVSGNMVSSAARFTEVAGTAQPPGPPDVIIESRTGGKNYALYDDNGMADLTDKSTAPGATPNIGSRYASSAYWGKRAEFSASISQSGLYKVYATWGEDSRIDCTDLRYFVIYDGIALVTNLDQSGPSSGNTWVLVSSARPFGANDSTQSVIVDNTDNTICPDTVIDRTQCPTNHFCVADAIKFVWAGQALAAPASLTATGGDKRVTLDWPDVPGASKYQVFRASEPGSYVGSNSILVSNLTSSSYTDTGLIPGTTYYYRARATDASGTPGFASDEASATTDAPPPGPTVSISADRTTLPVHQSVHFTPTVTLSPGVTAQEGVWEFSLDGAVVHETPFTGMPVAIDHTFDSVGDYSVVLGVTDINMQTGQSAAMIIHVIPGGPPPPTITQHPVGMTTCPGSTATFTVAATGDPPLTYQWQKNGSNLADGGHYGGVTTTTLAVSNATDAEEGNYRCVVSNPGGNTNSNTASLTVANCDDGNPCTVDTCDPNTGQCSHVPMNCDDGDPNTADSCVNGVCQHTPIIPQSSVVFSDGFNGNLNNWTQGTQSFGYNTTHSHGSVTGAGAAYCGAGEADQMYHTLTRPFAQGKVSAWFYDGKGGWKPSICGYSYRQALSLRDMNAAAKMYLDNEFYEATDSSKYFLRLVGAGGVDHTSYGTRNANTSCSAAWVYFETTVTPGAPGASPTGTFTVKVTDAAGSPTSTRNLTTDYFTYGIGRITLGLGVTSTSEGWWDDIKFEATPPMVPSMGVPVVLSTTQIKWTFSAEDNNFFGYDVADASGTMKSPQYPATGWLNHNATSWTESGLTANTQYARKIRAWNGTLNSALWSGTVMIRTKSPAPSAGSVTADKSTLCLNETVAWTAVGGFGPGKVQYYQYAWDQSPTYGFAGHEPRWSAGTLETVASAPGSWYLHVRGFNGDDLASGTYDYSVTVPDCDDGDPTTVDVCSAGACTNSPMATIPSITGAVSRKTHGDAGSFDVDVATANAVENRADGPTILVVSFDEPIQRVTGTVGDVTIASGTVTDLNINDRTLEVTMSGADNLSLMTVGFGGIATAGHPDLVVTDTLCFAVLAGDVTGDGAVNVFDLVATRNALNTSVEAGNFRNDVTADGMVNLFDLVMIRNALNTVVGSCP